MDWWMWLLIVGFAVLVLIFVGLTLVSRSRLREQFGPEYERAVESAGSRRDAEHTLRGRLREHRRLELRPLAPEAVEEYSGRWTAIQGRFVDAPAEACAEAETLLDEVLRARGYPVDEDFETQADLVSVDHPTLVEDYRLAHETHHGRGDGPERTEDLRGAFVAYRGLFEVVLDDEAEIDLTSRPAPPARADASREPADGARAPEPTDAADAPEAEAPLRDDADADASLTDEERERARGR